MENDPIPNPFDDDTPIESASAFDNSSMSPIEEDNSGRTFIWLILGVAAIGCGLIFAVAFIFFQPDAKSLVDRYFPSPTATLTRTPTPTPTPNLTATQRAVQFTATRGAIQTTIADANSQWNVLFSDTFDNNKNQWTTKTDDDYATILRTIKDGKYKWDATAKKGFIERVGTDIKPVTDFSLTVEGQQASGSASSDFGLVFRNDAAENFYYFGVGKDGFLVALNYNNEWVDVVSWTTSTAIHQDGTNRLTVIAEGTHFIFLINDQVVADAIDEHVSKGTLGLAVQVYEPDLQAGFEFDNLELRVPAPPATLTPTPNLTATSIAEDWKIVLADNFDSNKNGWETESSDNDRAKSIITMTGGKYNWDIASHKLAIISETANTKPLSDFVMSVDAKQISGPRTADYGVFFRENSSYYGYYFGINNKGEYILQIYNKDWIDLIDYTKSNLIRPGEVNRITVIAEGSHFIFFINGQYLTEFTDRRLKGGQVGLTTTLYDAGQHAVFEFDNFELRVP